MVRLFVAISFAIAMVDCASLPTHRSMPTLQQNCHGGDWDACATLGTQLAIQIGVNEATLERAKDLIEDACNAGSATGCRRLADLYLRGIAVPRDVNRAEVLLDLACAQYDANACLRAGLLYARFGESTKALEPLTTSCLAGTALACTQLASFYAVGGPVKQDRQRASWLYHEACQAGCQAGCEGLADMVASGDPEPAEEMLILLATACEDGHTRVCDSVAATDSSTPQPPHLPPTDIITACSPAETSRLHEDGNIDVPLAYHEKGCSMGNEDSCAQLSPQHGLLQAESKCVRGSLAACLFAAEGSEAVDAVAHYGRACELNHAPSCTHLGIWYIEGKEIPPDEEQGQRYLQRACSLGDTTACDELSNRRMAP